MIIDYKFYDKYPLAGGFKERMYYYLKEFIKNGGIIEYVDSSYQVSEIDYPRDLSLLHKSIDSILKIEPGPV